MFNSIETLVYFYQISYPKNIKVRTKLGNFLLNKIFFQILILFLHQTLQFLDVFIFHQISAFPCMFSLEYPKHCDDYFDLSNDLNEALKQLTHHQDVFEQFRRCFSRTFYSKFKWYDDRRCIRVLESLCLKCLFSRSFDSRLFHKEYLIWWYSTSFFNFSHADRFRPNSKL